MNTADLADMELAALAWIEACDEENRINETAVLGSIDAADMMRGLLGLAVSLRASWAAATGITVVDANELLRAHLMAAAGGAL